MIIPGKQLGKYKIGELILDSVDNSPEIKIILDTDKKIKLIRWSKSINQKYHFNDIITIGNTFSNVIREFDLLYDEFENQFCIRDSFGLTFEFDNGVPLSMIEKSSEITTILVHSKVVNEVIDKSFGYKKVTEENFEKQVKDGFERDKWFENVVSKFRKTRNSK